MRAFFLAWPAERILQTLSAKSADRPAADRAIRYVPEPNVLAQAFPLPLSAYVRLFSVKMATARSFYEAEALREGWSVRQFDRQISGIESNAEITLYESTLFCFVGRSRNPVRQKSPPHRSTSRWAC